MSMGTLHIRNILRNTRVQPLIWIIRILRDFLLHLEQLCCSQDTNGSVHIGVSQSSAIAALSCLLVLFWNRMSRGRDFWDRFPNRDFIYT